MCQYGFLWMLCVWKIKEREFCEKWEGKERWEIRACAYRCMGLAQVSSLGGSHYYVTFIDDAIIKDRDWLLRNGNAWLKMRLVRN